MNFKEYVCKEIAQKTGLDEEAVGGALEIPPEQKLGDLAFPCFVLAKTLRKAPPLIAKDLAQQFADDKMLGKVEAVGGYLNFFYNRAEYSKAVLEEIESKGSSYGSGEGNEDKTVLLEFSSPNIAKPFHIGHLFSTAVGSSLEHIYKHLGI